MSAMLRSRLRKLSSLQRAFVKLLLRTDNLAEAKKNAPHLSRVIERGPVEGIPNDPQEIFEFHGLALEYLLEKYLVPMLDATKIVSFYSKDKVKCHLVVPDLGLQLRALKLALELYGYGQKVSDSSHRAEADPDALSPTVH